jgi:hypothetical protein
MVDGKNADCSSWDRGRRSDEITFMELENCSSIQKNPSNLHLDEDSMKIIEVMTLNPRLRVRSTG